MIFCFFLSSWTTYSLSSHPSLFFFRDLIRQQAAPALQNEQQQQGERHPGEDGATGWRARGTKGPWQKSENRYRQQTSPIAPHEDPCYKEEQDVHIHASTEEKKRQGGREKHRQRDRQRDRQMKPLCDEGRKQKIENHYHSQKVPTAQHEDPCKEREQRDRKEGPVAEERKALSPSNASKSWAGIKRRVDDRKTKIIKNKRAEAKMKSYERKEEKWQRQTAIHSVNLSFPSLPSHTHRTKTQRETDTHRAMTSRMRGTSRTSLKYTAVQLQRGSIVIERLTTNEAANQTNKEGESKEKRETKKVEEKREMQDGPSCLQRERKTLYRQPTPEQTKRPGREKEKEKKEKKRNSHGRSDRIEETQRRIESKERQEDVRREKCNRHPTPKKTKQKAGKPRLCHDVTHMQTTKQTRNRNRRRKVRNEEGPRERGSSNAWTNKGKRGNKRRKRGPSMIDPTESRECKGKSRQKGENWEMREEELKDKPDEESTKSSFSSVPDLLVHWYTGKFRSHDH